MRQIRNRAIIFRVTEAEYNQIYIAANTKSISEYIRGLINAPTVLRYSQADVDALIAASKSSTPDTVEMEP